MKRLIGCITITISILSAAASATLAAPVDVEVRIVSKRDGATGLPSTLELLYDSRKIEAQTDAQGKAMVSLPRCDTTVRIVARPLSWLFYQTESACSASPLILQADGYSSAEAILFAPDHAWLADRPDLEAAALSVKQSVLLGDAGTAAARANDLAAALRAANDPLAAKRFSSIAIGAGFVAAGVDPYAAGAPLVAFDAAQDAYVMTEQGKDALLGIQSDLGVATTGTWDYTTFQKIEQGS